jgi:hypothetical protein
MVMGRVTLTYRGGPYEEEPKEPEKEILIVIHEVGIAIGKWFDKEEEGRMALLEIE